MIDKPKTSADSLTEATRWRSKFSGHGNALGAAGRREVSYNPDNCEELRQPGQSVAINPGADGFKEIMIGVAWDQIVEQRSGLFGKLGMTKTTDVDLDIGVLYELTDGTRGTLQAFGKKFGHLDKPPFMQLSGDEREGDEDGHDEYILVNGANWDKIKRILVYVYIYEGAPHWAAINPQIILDVPGEQDLVVSLNVHNNNLPICAVGGIENIRGGIKLTNYTEYFPGHPAMDRAFGFGLEWEDGQKDP